MSLLRPHFAFALGEHGYETIVQPPKPIFTKVGAPLRQAIYSSWLSFSLTASKICRIRGMMGIYGHFFSQIRAWIDSIIIWLFALLFLFNLRREEESSSPKNVPRHSSQLFLTLKMKYISFTCYWQHTTSLSQLNPFPCKWKTHFQTFWWCLFNDGL